MTLFIKLAKVICLHYSLYAWAQIVFGSDNNNNNNKVLHNYNLKNTRIYFSVLAFVLK